MRKSQPEIVKVDQNENTWETEGAKLWLNLMKDDVEKLHMCHLLYYILVTQKYQHSAHGTPSVSVIHKHNYNIHSGYREKLLLTLSNAFTSAPFPTNISQVSLWPFLAATCNGVDQFCSRESQLPHTVYLFAKYLMLRSLTELTQPFS